ncbi:MAG TPA: hypothetical protein VLU25_21570 [Acidobacteriota bacterium]|nr:hypothetical protein [Acidobacteriota bacterium]
MNSIIRLVILALLTTALAAQQRPREKPVLIRADQPKEQVEEEILPDPNQAQESLKIGQFYFKRKNYKAAASRFREAIRYLPTWPEPYEKLVESFSEMESWQEAIDACELFQATNPDHDLVPKFQSWAEELREKQKRKSEG